MFEKIRKIIADYKAKKQAKEDQELEETIRALEKMLEEKRRELEAKE